MSSTREKIATVVAAAILLVIVIYWIAQVLDVAATLRQVYG